MSCWTGSGGVAEGVRTPAHAPRSGLGSQTEVTDRNETEERFCEFDVSVATKFPAVTGTGNLLSCLQFCPFLDQLSSPQPSNLLTRANFVKQDPSSEVDIVKFLASCYSFHKNHLLITILSHTNLFHALSSYFFHIHFNTILPSAPRSSKWFLSLRFSHHNPVYTYPLSHACDTLLPPHSGFVRRETS
jgi:hypothetical protein